MAYEPNVWKCGDTITADQLNRLEQAVAELSQGGGQSGALVLRPQEEQSITGVRLFDKTWQEVSDAMRNGQLVTAINSIGETATGVIYLMRIGMADSDDDVPTYRADFGGVTEQDGNAVATNIVFTAPSADDYLRIVIPSGGGGGDVSV